MRHPLDFHWRYVDRFEESFLRELPPDAVSVDLPHAIALLPYDAFDEKSYQKVVTYEKLFDAGEDLSGRSAAIVFHGFMLKAQIYLNGSDLGEHVSGYVKVSLDVTGILRARNNRLLVVLDAREDKDVPPFGYIVDYLAFGGIYREVELVIRPKVHLEDVRVSADMLGNVKVDSRLVGGLSAKDRIVYEVRDGERIVHAGEKSRFLVEGPRLWSPEDPHLYTLTAKLFHEKEVDETEVRFGFRTAVFRKDGFYLNGKLLKLRGLNRHQSYPYMGYAAARRLQYDDVRMLKDFLGANVVRTSHYPQSRHFLDACDEAGLLVIDEVPGWQFIGNSRRWRRFFFDFLERMLIDEYSHPSLIARGVRIDESRDDHELYAKANLIARTIDPDRQTLGVRNVRNSEILEDVYAYNDFSGDSLGKGLADPRKVRTRGHPYLVSEYLGHMDPAKPFDDADKRLEHALRHARVLDDALCLKGLSGTIGWCFADYYTHPEFGAGDGICYHGVLDMFRNPKWAAYVYRSQREDVPVLMLMGSLARGDHPESIPGPVYLATNADYVEMLKNGKLVGRFLPDRKDYPHLRHPPVMIDDYVGASFDAGEMEERDKPVLRKILGKISCTGFRKMTIVDWLRVARLMRKYHWKYDDVVDLYNDQVATCHGEAPTYIFNAYKDGKLVATKTYGKSTKFRLIAKSDTDILMNGDTYDTARVALRFVDEYGNVSTYAQVSVRAETEGPIEIIGPKEFPLLGGMSSVYVRSREGGKGKAALRLSARGLSAEVDFEVS